MNLQLGSAIGTATISDEFLEGTFTLYAVQGLPPPEGALLARTQGGWIFLRATDGPLEWEGTYRTAGDALDALANVILQSYINELITRHCADAFSFTEITREPIGQRVLGTASRTRSTRRLLDAQGPS